jgi:hypothetical protein
MAIKCHNKILQNLQHFCFENLATLVWVRFYLTSLGRSFTYERGQLQVDNLYSKKYYNNFQINFRLLCLDENLHKIPAYVDQI